MNDLQNWIDENKLQVTFLKEKLLEIEGIGLFVYVQEKESIIEKFDEAGNRVTHTEVRLMDDQFQPILDEEEEELAQEADFYVFMFGDRFYYSPVTANKADLIPFKYLGKAMLEIADLPFAHLGIHGEYELLNGTREYKDWCKKAKFLGFKALGICEKNTMAGTLPFQLACQDAKIKSVLGETITILREDKIARLEAKVFALTEEGWQNMLRINKAINVDNEGFVEESELWKRGAGLAFVFSSHTKLSTDLVRKYKKYFTKVFYQIDTVEYSNNDKDREHLENLQIYFYNFLDKVDPILINDSYYLDAQDSHIKKILNKVATGASHNQSSDQHFKNLDDSFYKLDPLFPEQSNLDFNDIFSRIVENANWIAENSSFSIELGKLKLPKYEPDDPEMDSEELFWSIIETGLINKVPEEKMDEYIARLHIEVDVIQRGGFIDYFLILWDILSFCNREGILYGTGRGSAGGCLVSYLMDITRVDPIQYNLLFERFLNESRITKGLPDIDFDVQGDRRDEVKRYMERKYGVDHVTSIGTYTTLKVKAALKDVGRDKSVNIGTLNYINGALNIEGDKWAELFHYATEVSVIKKFINDNFELINDIQLCLNQPRSTSIHAAGVVVTPKFKDGKPMTVFDWMPVRKVDGVLVSEWEGPYIEAAGFLKEDILGIRQLDKFAMIKQLVKEHRNIELDLHALDLEDKVVYEFFQNGWNEDVFQFGAMGLKGYCKNLKPDNIEDLIATVALYRPGPIEIGAHNKYIKLKNGLELPEYDYMLQEVTENTYGIYIYQEQIMKAFQILGGFSLVEADGVRKAMGKKIKEQMDGYRTQFIKAAIEKGCEELEAQQIWIKLEAFAGYGFNRSHAAAYALTGYQSQFLKVQYPVEFWTTSLQFAKEDDITERLSEIKASGQSIEIAYPDINKSNKRFTPDVKNSKIYWSIATISYVGAAAVDAILSDREKNGGFYSIVEFCERIPKKKVNKRGVANLIFSGSFDEVYSIRKPQDRMKILKELYNEVLGEDVPDEIMNAEWEQEHFWTLRQHLITGLAKIDYQKIILVSELKHLYRKYITPIEVNAFVPHGDDSDRNKPGEVYERGKGRLMAGIVEEVLVKKTKKGKEFAQIVMFNDEQKLEATIWNDVWEEVKHKFQDEEGSIKGCVGRVMLISGNIVRDKWRTANTLHTQDFSQVTFVG